MVQVEDGGTVKVHYTGKLEDGTVIDTTENRDPLQLKIGDGEIISRIEQAMLGMEPGESKTVKVPANEAYGAHREDLVFVIDHSHIPADTEPNVGQQFQLLLPDSQTLVATVTNVTESSVELDANHQMAGEELIFDIQLMEIV
ncbi:MAG: peptidylprolyl isomerase [Methanosarcinales archaeon]|nr:MAG: peptidylprolyl isomerase [Methanosarcinales archaeon]